MFTIRSYSPNEGKVIEFEGEKMAVYKDNEGHLTALRPTCTYAGCSIYNQDKKT
ncbi:MAG: Rieske 2Fe-2S domain-containing protein [Pedobacter sp.]|nr:Rieske 2Fe-2S domain-containing protein [Pedobacter sp.]